MNIIPTPLQDVLILEPRIFGDDRGFFLESFNLQKFREQTGIKENFVQDNHSKSCQFVLRGMHYQTRHTQGKLVRVIEGEIFDAVVDLRQHSPNFGQWYGVTLSAENFRQLWVPKGFAHGFVVTSPVAQVLYKTTDYYAPEYEQSLLYNDPDIHIDWPLQGNQPILSAKDKAGLPFIKAHRF